MKACAVALWGSKAFKLKVTETIQVCNSFTLCLLRALLERPRRCVSWVTLEDLERYWTPSVSGLRMLKSVSFWVSSEMDFSLFLCHFPLLPKCESMWAVSINANTASCYIAHSVQVFGGTEPTASMPLPLLCSFSLLISLIAVKL